MFNITNSVQTLMNAESVRDSKLLNDDERRILLCAIRDSVTVMPGLPDHSLLVRQAIERMIDSERQRSGTAAKQGRKAQGVEESTELAARGTEESTEAATRAPEGGEEPTEDAGRADRPKSRKTKASASAPA